MKEKLNNKLIRICIIIVVIATIIFGTGIIIIRYQVEGETNLPFDISKITIISSVEGKDNKDDVNKWNITVNQVNDVYFYIDKNNNYNKTEIIDNITIENIKVNKENEKGQIHTYKPTEKGTNIFENNEENIVDKIEYTGDLESNIKQLKISNQGGIVVIRFSNDDISKFISNDGEQVDHNKLLSLTKINQDDIKTNVSFDFIIKLNSGKAYKANISLDLPAEDIIEKGTNSKEITDTKNIVFKRVENNLN